MTQSTQEQNKVLVLRAFDLLFNKRDYAAAEKFWSPHYIQHSAHIEPGREGLFKLIESLPATLSYEAGLVVAEGDFVIVTPLCSVTHSRHIDINSVELNSMELLPRNAFVATNRPTDGGCLHSDLLPPEATQAASMTR
jgi:predicted SnoaL-like aldol condensation-catalyzing enzyme